MERIKHVFFDLDHTLWDFDKNSALAFQLIFQEQNLSLSFHEFMEAYMPINLSYWKLYRDEKISKPELRYKRLKDTFDLLNYKVTNQLVNKIAEDYLNYLPKNNHLMLGAIDLLNYLQTKYKLHIITNGFREVQDQKMKQSGIKDYFDVIVTSESVGLKKPNPKVFNYALTEAKAAPAESVMIGDNYEADVLGAKNVGILPIHLQTNKVVVTNNVLTVNSLGLIKQYL